MDRLEELKVVELGEKIGYKKGFEAARKQFERPHGEWKKTDNRWGVGTWQCTHCESFYKIATKFCPNCGASMARTCGNCYWFSKVTVPCCEQDNEPTTENEKACDRWEEMERDEIRWTDLPGLRMYDKTQAL